MIDPADRAYLCDKLAAYIAVQDKYRSVLLAPFPDADFPRDLPSDPPQQLVLRVVHACLTDGWSHDPPWLLRLFDLLPDLHFDSKLQALQRQLRVPPPPSANPLDATLLADGSPFVNRARLRQRLRQLAAPAAAARPILVVSGPDGAGKSYSGRYIDHFQYAQTPAPAGQALNVCPLRFDPDDIGLALGPEHVARDLVALMGRPWADLPPPDTNLKLHLRQLAAWVLGHAAQSGGTHWLVFDNFKGERLRPETREFLVVLTDLVTHGVFPRHCRIILTGFDRSALTVDPGKIDEDKVQLASDDEVRTCVAEALGRAPVPAADLLPDVLPTVLAGLPAGPGRMPALNTRLRCLVHALDAVAELLRQHPGVAFRPLLAALLSDLPEGAQRLVELDRRIDDLHTAPTA